AELGATTTVWPSDENTRFFLHAQGREEDYTPLSADEDAVYDQVIFLDLSTLEPMIACPSSPDNVVPVREVAGKEVAQVIIGSCANSSYRDLMMVAGAVEGKTAHENISLEINPGSRQVLENIISNSGLMKLIQAGARVQSPGCLGCIGVGQAPASGTISLRTFTRNFPGRSGTKGDQVYLCSPETAVAAALTGRITDPRDLGDYPKITLPEEFIINDKIVIPPLEDTTGTEIIRGPNIKPFPDFGELPDRFEARVILKVKDNITTDHIMPAGSEILPLRSNIPAISRFVFQALSPDFAERAEAEGTVAVVGGENYGQGSSREHAAIAPRYLGVQVKLVKSFARIHKANLINFGILPLTFINPDDYGQIAEGEIIAIEGVRERVLGGAVEIPVQIGEKKIMTSLDASERQRRILAAGGLLNMIRQEG
ncbi:MAG: aconitate hydratase, partial [Deltaproteobacteria bacterium]|nr:aconitate hydratase [Deltaproteobacteria bacterium]MBW2324361.1 aconitate hydratase [Deltaproteobacteria bacterium]